MPNTVYNSVCGIHLGKGATISTQRRYTDEGTKEDDHQDRLFVPYSNQTTDTLDVIAGVISIELTVRERELIYHREMDKTAVRKQFMKSCKKKWTKYTKMKKKKISEESCIETMSESEEP
ncbi:hypothetical protein Zmor_000996 [Zophobas morio]|uniref:Uncharacterized protein n=1 Tax=Zophobas morio TaxID=2755281 RepID=A0AA38J7J4_9CUCU|nr:hypothetical protein Zmor_000996 [Zophobas morio]